MASKKRTDVVNELATDPNPMNEEETMNESVDKTLEETVEALANILPPPVEQYTAVAVICHGLSELDVDELKEVIDYCEERIDELQRDEVERKAWKPRCGRFKTSCCR